MSRAQLESLFEALRPRAVAPDASADAELRIDELARAAGTTVRNVRSYQERGLLPPPRREGRTGLYSSMHLARLRTIGALLERGYSTQNIAELLGGWDDGKNLGDLLGLEAALTSPFSDEAPATLTLEELARLFADADPEGLRTAAAAGLVELDGDKIRVPSLRLLRAGAELHRAGIPLAPLLAEILALRKDVDRIAGRLVELVDKHVFDRYGKGLPPPARAPELTDVVRRLRPLARVVVDTELAHALERHVRDHLGKRVGRRLAKK